MKKQYIFIIMLVLTLLVGCKTQNDIEPIISTQSKDINLIKKEDIVGTWEIEKAILTKDGKELDLGELYGSGIKYGGEVIFYENGETAENIGITSGEEIESKIIYEIDKNIIKVTCNGNSLREYEYCDIDGNVSLKSYREFDDELSHYLYFVKKEKTEEDITEVANKCKTAYKKYFDLWIEMGTGGADYVLKEFGLLDSYEKYEKYEKVKYDGYEEYYKTDIKYSDFRNAMLEYMSPKIFEKFEESFVKNVNGYLQVNTMGGSGSYIDILDFTLYDKDEYSYTFNMLGLSKTEGAPDQSKFSERLTFIKQNDRYILSDIKDEKYYEEVLLSAIMIEENDLVFINSIEMFESAYLINGTLYKNMMISGKEVEQKLSTRGTIRINGKEYSIEQNAEDSTRLDLQANDSRDLYYLEVTDNPSFYEVKSKTEFDKVWRKSDGVYIPVDKDARIIIDRDTGESIPVKDYYLVNKDVVREAEDTTNPSDVYSNFGMRDGRCVEFSKCITGH